MSQNRPLRPLAARCGESPLWVSMADLAAAKLTSAVCPSFATFDDALSQRENSLSSTSANVPKMNVQAECSDSLFLFRFFLSVRN